MNATGAIATLSLLLGTVCAAAAAPATAPAGGPPATAPAPHVVLDNGVLKLHIRTPDAATLSRDTRFDWSGRIELAEHDGHTYFGGYKTDDAGNRTPWFHQGTTDEFKTSLDILADGTAGPPPATQPSTAPASGPAVARRIRIGIGVLEPQVTGTGPKARTAWNLVKPLEWKIVTDDVGTEQRQSRQIHYFQSCNEGPWGYEYRKIVAIDTTPALPRFSITRTLKNTGAATIDTMHYCHNWTRIDSQYIGDQYRLTLNFVPQPITVKEPRKGKTPPSIDGTVIVPGAGFWAELGPQKTVRDNYVLMENTATGGQMTITGDWTPDAFNIYVQAGECCPEPFIHLVLPPGQSRTWKSTYYFAATQPASAPASAPAGK
jgi:hypothetical protein